MFEPISRSRSRGTWTTLVTRGAALAAAALLAVGLALPAAALGEDGPFPLPTDTDTVPIVPGMTTDVPLVALLEDAQQDELDLGSARLGIPEDVDDSQKSLMEVGEDSRSLAVDGEGTWALLDEGLVFTPLTGVEEPTTPIALTIGSHHDSRSLPAVLTPEPVELEETTVHGSAGTPTSLELGETVPADGDVRLELDGLPAGSTQVADGSRVSIPEPEQSVWQLSADRSTLTYNPSSSQLGRQPVPLRYVVLDGEGAPVGSGRVSVTVPIISDLYVSAPYGHDIEFAVGEGQQFVDSETLRLEPPDGEEGMDVDEEGTEVVVPDQGVWTLDRESATVRFSPESDQVRETAPMFVTGGDGEGAEAAPALLSTAYPILVDRHQSAAPGTEAVFDLTTGIRDVRSDSLRFDPEQLPEAAELSEDGTELVVPGEGAWTIDLGTRTVTMDPEEDMTGAATPVAITGSGVYADNPVSATLEAVFSPVLATLRDDEQRTAPGEPVTVDVLGNDTAGSGAQPLVPESVQLRSLAATNLSELEDGAGSRLVIPGEGTYTVAENGSVSFDPEPDFIGSTTPVEYEVLDSEGIPATATVVVEVDPEMAADGELRPEVGGINSLLAGLMPSSPSTSMVFGTIVLLLIFAGGVSLWIGWRIEVDRRTWSD